MLEKQVPFMPITPQPWQKSAAESVPKARHTNETPSYFFRAVPFLLFPPSQDLNSLSLLCRDPKSLFHYSPVALSMEQQFAFPLEDPLG